MKRRGNFLSVLPLAIVAAVVIWGLLWYAGGFRDKEISQEQLLEGVVTYIAANARVMIMNNENGRPINLALVSQIKIYDEGARSVDLSYVRRGSAIRVHGIYLTEDTFAPSSMQILQR
ncbi:MAG: hypothetical protein Q8P35_01845 [Candidatus Yanofskybacteria bacterium]|nr:hypothetical protein [Candidatus Yanofskybacteria bacterium]